MKYFNIDFNKDSNDLINDLVVSINNLIQEINNKRSYEDIFEEINSASKDFEDNCNDNNSSKEIYLRDYFYRELFKISENLDNVDFLIDVSNLISNNIYKLLKKKNKNGNPYYMCLIDTYMLTALYCYSNKESEKAREFFFKAVKVGEDNLEESKKNYHDALNCAYTWAGFYLFNEKKYDEALSYFETVLKLYDEVKDDPNYHIREKDSVPNSLRYIELIKGEKEKR